VLPPINYLKPGRKDQIDERPYIDATVAALQFLIYEYLKENSYTL
jgi:hypothetical protein